MARGYNIVDDYLGKNTECPTKAQYIKGQISILKDMYVLEDNDPREELLFNILAHCETERQIESSVRDLKTGVETLDAMLARKEVTKCKPQ